MGSFQRLPHTATVIVYFGGHGNPSSCRAFRGRAFWFLNMKLMLTAEEQIDYDSFALASPSVTRALLWKFAEETPSGSQTQP